MTQQQRTALDQMLRHGPLDLGGEVAEQRQLFAEMMSALPLHADVRTQDAALAGIPVVAITIEGVPASGTVLYFHGGAFAIGTAALSAGLASALARRSATRVVSVDYALAPERPYPAAVSDAVVAYQALLDAGTAASDIVLAGESAGGGLVIEAMLVILAQGLPRPAALYLVSPWADMTLSGTSMATKAGDDPSVTPAGLARRARDYIGEHDPGDGAISPVFADLSGLPPLLIQVGGNEVLLDDATRLAARAAASGVQTALEVTPDVPHVFVSFTGILDEADEALNRAGDFIRTHLDRTRD